MKRIMAVARFLANAGGVTVSYVRMGSKQNKSISVRDSSELRAGQIAISEKNLLVPINCPIGF